MGKIGHKKTEESEEDEFSPMYVRPLRLEELQSLNIEIQKTGGYNQYLNKIKPRVVHLNEQGGIKSIITYTNPTLIGNGIEVIPGTGIKYEVDVPYFIWERIKRQLDKYRYGLKKGQEEKNEQVQEDKPKNS